MNHILGSASYFNQDLKAYDVNNIMQCYDFSLFASAWTERKKLNLLIFRNKTEDLTTLESIF